MISRVLDYESPDYSLLSYIPSVIPLKDVLSRFPICILGQIEY
jgi:hypothetical protein